MFRFALFASVSFLLSFSFLHAQELLPSRVEPKPSVSPPELMPNIDALRELDAVQEVPELSELDRSFERTAMGKQADDYRKQVELRKLKNRVVDDPEVVALLQSAQEADTDLERRNRYRSYYNLLYGRIKALATTAELRKYVDEAKKTHINALAQPRVRP